MVIFWDLLFGRITDRYNPKYLIRRLHLLQNRHQGLRDLSNIAQYFIPVDSGKSTFRGIAFAAIGVIYLLVKCFWIRLGNVQIYLGKIGIYPEFDGFHF